MIRLVLFSLSILLICNFSYAAKNEVCPDDQNPLSQKSATSLTNTYWKLVYLSDTTLEDISEYLEPHLVFDKKTLRVFGSSGCNRFSGSYKISGNNLSFSAMIGTRMACSIGMKTESGFIARLVNVSNWEITASQLELSDTSGKILVKFTASTQPVLPK